MFDKKQKLEISREDLAVIEAALHTQSRILDVQASAGGNGARARLNDVKKVLALLAHQAPAQAPRNVRPSPGRLGLAAIFG